MITPDVKSFPRTSAIFAVCEGLRHRKRDAVLDWKWNWDAGVYRATKCANRKVERRALLEKL